MAKSKCSPEFSIFGGVYELHYYNVRGLFPYVFEYYPNKYAVTQVPLKGCTDPVDPSTRITNTTCEKKRDDCDKRKHEDFYTEWRTMAASSGWAGGHHRRPKTGRNARSDQNPPPLPILLYPPPIPPRGPDGMIPPPRPVNPFIMFIMFPIICCIPMFIAGFIPFIPAPIGIPFMPAIGFTGAIPAPIPPIPPPTIPPRTIPWLGNMFPRMLFIPCPPR